MRTSNRSSIPRRRSTSRQLVLDDTTAVRSPAARAAPHEAHRPLVRRDAPLADEPKHQLVLALAESGDRLGSRRVVRAARRELDRARGEERPHAVEARLAVDELVVVVHRVEGDECLAGPGGPPS